MTESVWIFGFPGTVADALEDGSYEELKKKQ